jgi:hypothetical protein
MSDQESAPTEMRKLLVQKERGEDFIIEVESTWKLTFGAVNPGSQMTGRDLHCLRIYDGPNTKTAALRAVICDVKGFRDLSIPLARKVSMETGSATWTQDSGGNFERSESRAIESSIVVEDSTDVPF